MLKVVKTIALLGLFISLTFFYLYSDSSDKGIPDTEIKNKAVSLNLDKNSEQATHNPPNIAPEKNQLTDYYDIALSLIASAQNGDANAQLQLAQILEFCTAVKGWKASYEINFSLYKNMPISDADLKQLENIEQDMINCSSFESHDLTVFSPSPTAQMNQAQIYSYWYLQASMNGHPDAVIQGLHYIVNNTEIDNNVKAVFQQQIKTQLMAKNPKIYVSLATFADNELDQLVLADMACKNAYECNAIKDNDVNSQLLFSFCMEDHFNKFTSGVSSERSNCTSNHLNSYISKQKTKYSERDIAERTIKISNAANEGNLELMGLTSLNQILKPSK